ncbi:hypothetical protein [Halarchaeum acidiphilum]|uniref:hypothetical protein n=1 Tax=Halarchaeum acidiphilum TaxID=489138 RepID=UPI0003657FBF|nr:hypothetical protein [Halarchaeum acidiphilum]
MECPDCGGSCVSQEIGPNQAPSTQLADAILDVEEGDHVVFTRQCWTCGWSEDRHIKVTAIETDVGDPAIVERQQRLSELVDELQQIDDDETLKAALRDVRRRRQSTDNATTEPEEDGV